MSNKTITCGTPKLWFGDEYPTQLPDGWTLRESPCDWAFGVDPEERVYFLSKDTAYPCRIAEKDVGSLKKGEIYIDLHNGVVSL